MVDAPKERRGSVRVDVELWVEESRDRETYFQRCKNLSAGGLYLDRTLPHPVGTVVRLRFPIPDGGPAIETRGRIVNAADEHLGMGIQFVELTDDDRRRIETFVGAQKAQ